MTRSRHILGPRRRWSADEDETLRINYPRFPTFLIAHVLGRSSASVTHRVLHLGLKKAADFYTQPNARLWFKLDRPEIVARRFKPGHVPANKGTRRPGWAPGRMATTQFKKGARPHTWKPIGSTRVNADGYLDRKVSDTGYPPRDWQAVHRLVWIAAHGPVPPKHRVAFKHGRRTTKEAEITLDALECISFAEGLRRNSFRNNYPKEIVHAIEARAILQRSINQACRRAGVEVVSARKSRASRQPNRRSHT